jgi:hypothetical protein
MMTMKLRLLGQTLVDTHTPDGALRFTIAPRRTEPSP